MRATPAPAQRCGPAPKVRCLFGLRSRRISSGCLERGRVAVCRRRSRARRCRRLRSSRPCSAMSCEALRPKIWIGAEWRRNSSTAVGISAGSAASRANASGCSASQLQHDGQRVGRRLEAGAEDHRHERAYLVVVEPLAVDLGGDQRADEVAGRRSAARGDQRRRYRRRARGSPRAGDRVADVEHPGDPADPTLGIRRAEYR